VLKKTCCVKREEKLEAFEKLLRALLWPSFRAYGQPAKPWKTAQGCSQEVIEGWIALKLRFGHHIPAIGGHSINASAELLSIVENGRVNGFLPYMLTSREAAVVVGSGIVRDWAFSPSR
jgi:hypothetical protein